MSTVLSSFCQPAPRAARLSCLRRSFPNACPGHLDDAVQEAAIALWMIERRGQTPPSDRGALTIAWRALRGLHRRATHRRELPLASLPEGVLAPRQVEQLAAQALLEALPAQVRWAARRFGAGRVQALEAALWERFADAGPSDEELASAHGLRREVLSRAKLQVRLALRGR